MVWRRLNFIFFWFILIQNCFAVTTITFTSDYSIKNYLLAFFLLVIFGFWWLVFSSVKEKEFDKRDLITSLSNLVVKTNCFIWFGALIYIFQAVLFISTNENFLTDKLDLIYNLIIMTVVLYSFVLLINITRLYDKIIGVSSFFNEFLYQFKKGGRK